MKTRVVNLRSARCDVYIGRRGKGQDGYFGNPYRIKRYGDQTHLAEVMADQLLGAE